MLKGLGNLGNIASMMSAFQELPQKMQELNARMQSEYVSGESTCGRVTVTVSCVGEVQSVTIVQEEISTTEIESATREATNHAGASAKEAYANAIREMVGEMNLDLPGVENLLSSFTGR